MLGSDLRAYKALCNAEILEQFWLMPAWLALEVCWKQMLRKHSGVSCAAEVGVQGSRSNTTELSGKLFSGDAGLNRAVTQDVSLLEEIIPRELGRTKKHHSLFCPDHAESWLPSVPLL